MSNFNGDKKVVEALAEPGTIMAVLLQVATRVVMQVFPDTRATLSSSAGKKVAEASAEAGTTMAGQ
jgi:hypothetical protein